MLVLFHFKIHCLRLLNNFAFTTKVIHLDLNSSLLLPEHIWTCCELCWDNKIAISLLTKLPAAEIWPEFREWKVDRLTQRWKRCTEKHIIISNLLDWPHSMITTHYSVLALIYTGPWRNLQPSSKKRKAASKMSFIACVCGPVDHRSIWSSGNSWSCLVPQFLSDDQRLDALPLLPSLPTE